MAQTNYTPISLYYSTTASAVPTAANLVQGELAINTNDGKLYYEDSSGVVQTLASKAGALGDVVGPASATDNALARFDLTTGKLIQNSVGILSDAGVLTGLTGLTSSGSITLSSLTSGRVTYAGASGLLSDSANLTWNGTNLGITGTLSATGNISSTAGGFFSTRASGNSPILDLTQTGVYTWDLINTATTGLFSIRGNTTPALSITSATYNVGIGVAPGGTTRLSVTASSGSLATFQQTGATGYGVTIVPGADTTYDAFTINNAANSANNIRMFGNGNATFAGNVGIGTSSPVAKLDVNGQINTINIVSGIRNNITSTDRISVTGATTIFSIATSGSSVGASSAIVLVNGYDTGTTTNSFTDLVLYIGGVTPVVVSTVNRGSPAARTYTTSGTALQLAMASGTYNVATSSTEQAC